MKVTKDEGKQIGIKANKEEVAMVEWLAKQTKRTRSGALKWAADKVAKELGYVPEESKRKK